MRARETKNQRNTHTKQNKKKQEQIRTIQWFLIGFECVANRRDRWGERVYIKFDKIRRREVQNSRAASFLHLQNTKSKQQCACLFDGCRPFGGARCHPIKQCRTNPTAETCVPHQNPHLSSSGTQNQFRSHIDFNFGLFSHVRFWPTCKFSSGGSLLRCARKVSSKQRCRQHTKVFGDQLKLL